MSFVVWSSLLACCALAACAPYAREGCDALRKRQPSPKDVSRIAGSVASESDLETSVVAGGTTTLNVRLINGPATGYLALPDAAELSQVQELAWSL